MKSWKKCWEEELDNVIPPLSNAVKNTPIPPLERETIQEKKGRIDWKAWKNWFVAHKNRVLGGVATAMASVIALCIILPNVISKPNEGDGSPTTGNPPVKTSSVFLLEINPSVVFTTDLDGKISSVVAMNADADLILSDEARLGEMQEKNLKDGVQVFVDYAAQLGFLDFSKESVVRLSGENEDKVSLAAQHLEGYFCQQGAYVAVVQETLNLGDFCERAGLERKESVDELSENIKQLSPLYSERKAEGKTEEELKTLYSEFVPFAELEALISLIEVFDPETAEKLHKLLELPKNVEEYAQKLEEYFRRSFENLQEKYAQGYGQVRDELTKEAYEAYIKGIEEAYGSLGAYWESKRGA